jgi:beta-phosphoglucomutase-like phosphatase (HAD superfamily)
MKTLASLGIFFMRDKTSFIFDLDGTLTDSVYQNVAAWKEALDAEGIPTSSLVEF